jgi:hypothetical protein
MRRPQLVVTLLSLLVLVAGRADAESVTLTMGGVFAPGTTINYQGDEFPLIVDTPFTVSMEFDTSNPLVLEPGSEAIYSDVTTFDLAGIGVTTSNDAVELINPSLAESSYLVDLKAGDSPFYGIFAYFASAPSGFDVTGLTDGTLSNPTSFGSNFAPAFGFSGEPYTISGNGYASNYIASIDGTASIVVNTTVPEPSTITLSASALVVIVAANSLRTKRSSRSRNGA